MDNLNELLSSLSQEDMDSLKNIASSLMGGGGSAQQVPAVQPGAAASGPPAVPADNGLGGLGIDPAMMGKIMGLMKQLNRSDDSRVQLINALKPMLSEPRRKKADEAMKMMRLLDLVPLLREQGIF